MLKSETERKRDAFAQAINTIDGTMAEETNSIRGFQDQVAHAEGIARDNLAYFEDNGYLALGSHFDEFLATLNANQLSVYPQAGGPITLPKEFSEKDRAFLAHGLVKAMGPEAKIENYFDVPGYRLKSVDASGEMVLRKIRSGLEQNEVLKDGGIRLQALESSFQGNYHT